jgi:hypothetical protein
MADPIPHDLLTDGDTRLEAVRIGEAFMIETVKADENAAILAAAWFFEDLCEERDIDPIDALCQLLDLPRPELETVA